MTEAHDYMSGNLDKVLETIADHVSSKARTVNSLTLREYNSTNITKKTAVGVYRDESDGFLITAFFTSKPDKIEKKGKVIWSRSQEN